MREASATSRVVATAPVRLGVLSATCRGARSRLCSHRAAPKPARGDLTRTGPQQIFFEADDDIARLQTVVQVGIPREGKLHRFRAPGCADRLEAMELAFGSAAVSAQAGE